jgi:hypothetical protein
LNGHAFESRLYHFKFTVNPALPLLLLGQAPGIQAVEVVPRARLEGFETRLAARFVAVPKGAAALTFPDYSPELVSEIERLLERARTETTALAEDEAALALASAERLLHDHPELPQAAWLMAERHELAALLAERTAAPGADELRRRARALEPERAPTFRAEPSAATATDAAPASTFSLALRGARASDRLEWDGKELAFPADVVAGEHQLRVLRGGELVWAGWVSVGPTTKTLQIDGAVPAPCSQSELGSTRSAPQRPLPPPDVRCPAWAVMRIDRGVAELALCHRAQCGLWHREPDAAARSRAGAPIVDERRIPRWATIALAGAGAALLTSVTLWQLGAFERTEQRSARWVYQGFVPPAPEE